ncbi:MAG: quinone-dependent dihydroorotate dehydrogenase [Corynebacterium sp.]|nr:quinone-dependent dihydroorotate dehydrogenase [Corynebacterium sp.]
MSTHALRKQLYQLALAGMFRIDPERIHHLVTGSTPLLQAAAPVRAGIARLFELDPEDAKLLTQNVCGVSVPRPVGLAAGFDKDARSANVWSAFGFGFAELGTVTASAQPGNPTPRLFRLPADHAIINRMGFNNHGAAAAARNLARRGDSVVGINIGKTKVVPLEKAVDDYRTSARLLARKELADYVVVNVSSPNTPGLRDLQAVESLAPIMQVVKDNSELPVFVKIAPDLADEDIDAVAEMALELELAGIIATNTTITRDGLTTPAAKVEAIGAGGLSGPVLAPRALAVLTRLRSRVGDLLTLIGVGGISSGRDAWERIAAGASLVQVYTAFIYGGPDLIGDIHRDLARQVRAHGLDTISAAVGSGLPYLPA